MQKRPTNANEQVPGYRATLLQRSTKERLQAFRSNLADTELFQERRLATAAIDVLLASPELHGRWITAVANVVQRELESLELTTQQS